MIEPEEPRHFKLKQLDASTLCRIAGRDVSKTTKIFRDLHVVLEQRRPCAN